MTKLTEEPFEYINIPNPNKDQTPRSTETSECRTEKSSEFQVSMNLFKAFIGIGVLTLGYGIKQAGLIQANILMLIGAFFTYWSINLLITIVEKLDMRITSFDQLAYLLLGPWGARITKTCVVILQVGTGVTYVFFFGGFFRNIFCRFGFIYACDQSYISLTLVLFLILPLHMIRTLTKYSYFSLVANLLIIFSLVLVIGFLAKGIDGVNGNNLFDLSYFPAFFGISLFSIESLSIILEIRDSMKNPLLFRRIFIRQFSITAILYTILPSFFYIVLGDNIKEIILFNIPIEEPIGLIVQTSYGIALLLSFPLQMYPVFLMFEKAFRNKTDLLFIQEDEPLTNRRKFYYRLKWIISRVLLCILLVVIAYVIPDFAWFLNILGAVGSTVLGMIIPVVLAEKYFIIMGMHKESYSRVSRYGNIGTMMIGIVGGVLATYYSLDYMVGKP